ncbi:NAD-dependent epimerase/dehydratase family protein [Algicella marina]|uniref:NAD-dependent epimerase/dehydratase family protein n=1 Tax=Algicella marina TaxID=2683284 RepID=A0A6P1T1C4_9RHOB|nr:NAD(P)-dependent oxidoreductase [Algicella marina]QHQ34332.1 NAD-dependent epimerase/dehydratase family protein [Algicella marina]
MTVIALTGAAGRLGGYLREALAKRADKVILTDRVSPEGLRANEEFRQAELDDYDAVHAALAGADVVLHFGAIADEAPWDEIWGPNFVGARNVWEAAHQHGIRRVIYASSIHAVGMYPRTQRIGVDTPHYPDSFYGLSKCFAENLGRLYWEKRGIESVMLRIYSCAQPNNERSLGVWLSPRDLVQLVEKSLDCPIVGCSVVYGVSANSRCPVSNEGAKFLGYEPVDNAEEFAPEILAAAKPDPSDKAQLHHGNVFATGDLGVSAVALMGRAEDGEG